MIKIFDELDDRWNEEGYDPENDIDINTEFEILFNDEDEGNHYIISGSHQLWHGTYEGHSPKVYNSIKDAITDSEDGFGICYTQIFEGNYGKLTFNTIHHDGTNRLEIKQLTRLGEQLYLEKDYRVGSLLKRKGATKNIRLSKR